MHASVPSQKKRKYSYPNQVQSTSWTKKQKHKNKRTVFATVCANSSKLNFPSPSWSASMIVLSTICWSCWSWIKRRVALAMMNGISLICLVRACWKYRPLGYSPPSFWALGITLHSKCNHLDQHHTLWKRLQWKTQKWDKLNMLNIRDRRTF